MDTENSWEDYDEDNDPDYEPDDAEMQEDEDNDEDPEMQIEDELEREAVDNDEVSQPVVINIGDLLAGDYHLDTSTRTATHQTPAHIP